MSIYANLEKAERLIAEDSKGLDSKGVKGIREFYQEMKRVDKAITDMMVNIPWSETDFIKESKSFQGEFDNFKKLFFSRYKDYLK